MEQFALLRPASEMSLSHIPKYFVSFILMLYCLFIPSFDKTLCVHS